MSYTQLQNAKISCRGGLDLRSTYQELLGRPGVAAILENFECDRRGGYRSISGYRPFGEVELDDNGAAIKGIHIFNNSILIAKGDALWHTFDGLTWLQVNKEVSNKTTTEMELEVATPLASNAEVYRFTDYSHGTVTEEHMVTITNGVDEVMVLKVAGNTSGTAMYSFEFLDPISSGAPAGCTLCYTFQDQVYLSGSPNKPSTIFVSTLFDPYTYTGSSSLEISTADPVVALQPFRDNMVVFCKNSIFYLREVNTGQPLLQPITTRLGCLETDSVQEVAGDIVFLSREGIRSLGATERIGDVELSSISNTIQPLIDRFINNISQYKVSSVVLRNKNQYRLYFNHRSFDEFDDSHIGFIGTLFEGEGGMAWNWSTTKGLNAEFVTEGIFDNRNISLSSAKPTQYEFALSDGELFELSDGEVLILGAVKSLLYEHDAGNTFDTQNISIRFKSHQTDFGDPSIRKNLHRVRTYLVPEGELDLYLNLIYTGYGNTPEKSPTIYPIAQGSGNSTWGSAVWGDFSYGLLKEINVVQNTEGSGFTIGFEYASEDSDPFNIQGWDVDFRPSGKV